MPATPQSVRHSVMENTSGKGSNKDQIRTKIAQSFKKASEIEAVELNHYRGAKRQYNPTISDGTLNPGQDKLTNSVREYISNKISQNEFRGVLRECGCEIDSKMNTLIRRQEAGDNVTFNEIGKIAFRNMNGTGSYNRVDKINVANSSFVAPENVGKNYHQHQEIDRPTYDKISTHVELRTVGNNYQQTRGKGVQSVNQLQSSMGNFLNHEESKKHGGSRIVKPNVKTSDFQLSAGNLINWQSEAIIEPAWKSALARQQN